MYVCITTPEDSYKGQTLVCGIIEGTELGSHLFIKPKYYWPKVTARQVLLC